MKALLESRAFAKYGILYCGSCRDTTGAQWRETHGSTSMEGDLNQFSCRRTLYINLIGDKTIDPNPFTAILMYLRQSAELPHISQRI